MEQFDENFFKKIPEQDEREAVDALLIYSLETVTQGDQQFEHYFSTMWEIAAQLLVHCEICTFTNTGAKLRISREKIPPHLKKLPRSARPLMEDCVIVALSLSSHYSYCLYDPTDVSQTVECEPNFEFALKKLGLISSSNRAHPNFIPFFLNEYGFEFDEEDPNPAILKIVRNMAKTTWENAPQKFRDYILDPQSTTLMYDGVLSSGYWRFGRWLDPEEMPRRIDLFNCGIDWIIVSEIKKMLSRQELDVLQ